MKKRSKPSTSTSSTKLGVKSFLDTSAVVKLQIGHSTHKKYLAQAIPEKWYVNNYVKMEYYRASLMHGVFLYFESEDPFHRTFGDALNFYSDSFSARGPKSLLTWIGILLDSDGFMRESPATKEVCRQRLQDSIFVMALQFTRMFTDMGKDPTRCARVPHELKIPEASERDRVLQALSETFTAEKKCRGRCNIESLMRAEPYKTKMGNIASILPKGKAKEALERIGKAIGNVRAEPKEITCRCCARMGDAIIASILDPNWKLHSLDLVHKPISEAIGLEHQIHQSLPALKNAAGAGDL